MSSFIATATNRAPIEWREKAYETCDRDSCMTDCAIALLAGLGVASFASSIAGVAVGAFLVKRMFDKESRKQQCKDLIVQTGLVAPFLDGHEFQDFVAQAGAEATYQELKFADDRGLELSDQAWELIEEYERHNPQAKLAPAIKAPVTPPQIDTTPPQIQPALPEPVQPAPQQKPGINVAEVMTSGEFVISRLIIGASRTGKSQLASDGLGYIRLRYGTSVTIYYLSAGFIAEEDGRYWQMCDRVSGFYFPDMSDAGKRLAYKGWSKLIEEFTAIPSNVEQPKILVIDELNSAISTAMRLGSEEANLFVQAVKGKLADVSSMGAKRGVSVWGLAPTGAMGDMGLTKANVSAMNPVFVAQIPSASPGWNETVYQTAKTNGLAPRNPPTQDVIDECESLRLTRIVGAGGKWLPLAQSPKIAEQFGLAHA
jgi:hypothetical protein